MPASSKFKFNFKISLFGFFNILILMVIVSGLSYFFLFNKANKIDEENVFRSLWRSVNVLDLEYEDLANLVEDWGAWDDTYEFIEDQNEDYKESTLVLESFYSIDVSDIVYLNEAKEILYSAHYDLENGEVLPLQDDLKAELTEGKLLDLDINKADGGLLFWEDRTVVIAVNPILDSKKVSNSRGLLMMVRELNEEKVESIEKVLNHSIEFLPMKEELLGEDVYYKISSQKNNFIIAPQDEKILKGYTPLTNVYGETSEVLKIEKERTVRLEMFASIKGFLILILISNSASLLISHFFMRKEFYKDSR